MFLHGNISQCQECGGKIEWEIDGSMPSVSADLIIQHKEFITFKNPNTDKIQQPKYLRNVYYHVKKSCIRQKFPFFNSQQQFHIKNEVRVRLTELHSSYIHPSLANYSIITCQFSIYPFTMYYNNFFFSNMAVRVKCAVCKRLF